jgi:hypothetical protein
VSKQKLLRIPEIEPLYHGSDPELFVSQPVGKVSKRQAVVASENFIPVKGLKAHHPHHGRLGQITRDGVQVELHPDPSTCRQSFTYYLAGCIAFLRDHLTKHNTEHKTNYQLDFRPVIKLSKADLMQMSPDAIKLSCTPSLNAYGHPHIEKDGSKYLIRSTAGHCHLGTNILKNGGKLTAAMLVKILDVLVGNMMVLVDRHPDAALRRKVYGRAGEYRLPKHGLEYRTLSNFWLRHYILVSMVFGQVALAHHITVLKGQSTVPLWLERDYPDGSIFKGAYDELMGPIDFELIQKAINTNDWDLAKDNYEKWIRPFLAKITTDANRGLDADLIRSFDYFVSQIRKAELAGSDDPLNVWFKEDPMTYWTYETSRAVGSESFLLHLKPSLPKQFSGFIYRETKKSESTNIIVPPTDVGAPIAGILVQ